MVQKREKEKRKIGGSGRRGAFLRREVADVEVVATTGGGRHFVNIASGTTWPASIITSFSFFSCLCWKLQL